MFSPSSITIGELSSAIKDYGSLFIIISVAWKARGAIQPCIDFVKKVSGFIDRVDARLERGDKHMEYMEGSMHLLLNNHLAHLKTEDNSSEKKDG